MPSQKKGAAKNKKRKKTFSGKGMVDISQKAVTERYAMASAFIQMSPATLRHLLKKGSPKGDVLETARVAGIMAAKRTAQIIPFCHPLALNYVKISFKIHPKTFMIQVLSEVQCAGRTGVEMEALTAVSGAALTIYDMMKWMDREMAISDIQLLKKTGGQSGPFARGTA